MYKPAKPARAALTPTGTKGVAKPLKTQTNPLRKTVRQRLPQALPKVNLMPTATGNTQPASVRGTGMSVSGMKKLAQGRAGRVVKKRRI